MNAYVKVKDIVNLVMDWCPDDDSTVAKTGDLRELLDEIENMSDIITITTCEECKYHVDNGYHWCNKWKQNCPDDSEFFCKYGG